MQSINQPSKILVPFAQNDSAKVELPVTTSDPGRMSQSLGSPPATGMPPEAGGVPPQLEDFNGAMNQQSRIAWWNMAGGRFGYDATWANDALINGYAAGAVLPSADRAGEWYNTADNNTADPDSNGANWVPGYHYGAYALTGLTGGTINLLPSSAAKRVLTLAGTLTSNQVLVVPSWTYDWVVYNNTSGAFSVTVKTAAGSGALIPQNGAPTPVRGDGTNVALLAPNIGPATSESQAVRLDQVVGRYLRATASGSWVVPAGITVVCVDAVASGGGGGGSGAGATTGGAAAVGGGGGGGGAGQALVHALYPVVPGSTVTWTIGAGGAGSPATPTGGGATGGAGANLVLSGTGFNGGTTVTLSGGGGGGGGTSAPSVGVGASGGAGAPLGAPGSDTVSISSSLGSGGGGGNGASCAFGGGGSGGRGAAGVGVAGAPAAGYGGGGGGAGGTYLQGSGAGGAGGAGAPGFIALSW